MHDVIVIGGGPAGAFCAQHLAKKGFSCLLLERSKPDRYKSCGGIINSQAFQSAPIPDSCIQRTIERMRIYSLHNVVELNMEKEAYTVYRTEYDQWLREQAQDQGAQVHYGEDVKKVDLRTPAVKTTSMYSCQVVVGAFGACPCLYDEFGVSIPRWIQMVQQEFSLPGQEVTDTIGNCIEFYFDTHYASYGFSWIIPKGEGVTVGAVFTPRTVKKRQRLTAFIRDHQKKLKGIQPKKFRRKFTFGGFLPFNPVTPSHGEHFLLVGDSAGFYDPVTFEGIPSALNSGRMAAQAIEDHLEQGTSLARYEHLWKRDLYESDIKPAQTLRRLLYGHPHSDALLDTAVELACKDTDIHTTLQWLFCEHESRKKVRDIFMNKKLYSIS